MTRFLVAMAVLMAWTVAPLAAGSSDSTPPPSKQCDNDKDNDGKEQPPKCDDSDSDGK